MTPSPEIFEVHSIKIPMGSHLSESLRAKIRGGRWETREVRAVRRWLRPTDVVLELGAGIGVVSTACAKIVGSSNVHAFEANPALEGPIRELYAINDVAPRLEVCVLASRSGTTTLHVSRDFWVSSTVASRQHFAAVRVQTRDFNEVRKEVSPTLMVMDIEGGELELIRHADLRGIRTVIAELHPQVIGEDGCDEVVSRLRRAGFRVNSLASRKHVFVLHRAFSRDDLRARLDARLARRRGQTT